MNDVCTVIRKNVREWAIDEAVRRRIPSWHFNVRPIVEGRIGDTFGFWPMIEDIRKEFRKIMADPCSASR